MTQEVPKLSKCANVDEVQLDEKVVKPTILSKST